MPDYKTFLDKGIDEINAGKFRDGIKNINKSLELKNDWEIPYFFRGVANHALGQYDEATLDYTKALQFNKKMTDAYYNRARIILTRKDIENPNIKQAVEDLERLWNWMKNLLMQCMHWLRRTKNWVITTRHLSIWIICWQ